MAASLRFVHSAHLMQDVLRGFQEDSYIGRVPRFGRELPKVYLGESGPDAVHHDCLRRFLDGIWAVPPARAGAATIVWTDGTQAKMPPAPDAIMEAPEFVGTSDMYHPVGSKSVFWISTQPEMLFCIPVKVNSTNLAVLMTSPMDLTVGIAPLPNPLRAFCNTCACFCLESIVISDNGDFCPACDNEMCDALRGPA